MSQNQEERYKHYERPRESRAATHKASSKGWATIVACLVIILVALVPIVHHLASADKKADQVVELRKSSKKQKQRKAKNSTKKVNKKIEKKPVAKSQSKSQAKSKLKASEDSSGEYVVQTGDSLTSIAAQFNTTVDDLMQLNNLDSNGQVYAGQTIKVK